MASYVENVLNKMASTPTFRPSNLNTFGDWSIEAGDVIAAVVDGVSEVVPVFNSDMSWHGAADVQLGASGNLQREVQDRLERTYQQYFGGLYDDIKDVEEDTLYIANGLDQVTDVTYDEQRNPVFALSQAKVFAQIADATGKFNQAFLDLKVEYEEDHTLHSLAALMADLITLYGKVQILNGYLDFPVGSSGIWIHDGSIDVHNSRGVPSYISNLSSNYVYAPKVTVGTDGLYITPPSGGQPHKYEPQEITFLLDPTTHEPIGNRVLLQQ